MAKIEIKDFLYIEEIDTIISLKDIMQVSRSISNNKKYALLKIVRDGFAVTNDYTNMPKLTSKETSLFFAEDRHGENYIEIRDDVFNRIRRELCGIPIPRKVKTKAKQKQTKKESTIPSTASSTPKYEEPDEDEVPF